MRLCRCVPFFCVVAVFSTFALGSCSEEPVSRVEREKLFTLTYGRFEDQIDLFQLDSDSAGPDTQIFMRDGMFYISNSGSKKILQLTSFGDLLSVYYNPDANPSPSFAQDPTRVTDPSVSPAEPASQSSGTASSTNTAAPATSVAPATATTRKAVSYPFNHPVYLTVDSLKRFFVVDQLPRERFEYDSDSGVVLRDVVLRFTSDGRTLDYLGQEGAGGTPFPPITGVYNNSKNEIIVVTKTQSAETVYWYSSDGSLLFKVPVSLKDLPSPYEKGKNVMPSLEKILPDQDERRIYLKIDYYCEVIDEATRANAGISFDKSCLYPFSIDSGKYEERVDLSSFEGVDKDNLGTVSFRKPYELLGITTSGWIFLSTPAPGGYEIEMMDSRSHRIHKRNLPVGDDEQVYNALMLSNDGILSALLATPYEASLVWWRTDALIGEIRR